MSLIFQLCRQCKDNGPLYQAFSVDQIVNLTEVLDLDVSSRIVYNVQQSV